MQLELQCPHCEEHFVHEPEALQDPMTGRVVGDVWGHVLGDGSTLEDMLHAALSEQAIHCPGCEAPVPMNQDDLSRLAMTMLESW
jgi:hypothetical protein